MGLKEFAQKNEPRSGVPCGVGISSFRDEIEEGIAGGIAATVIAKWLQEEHGARVSDQQIRRHVRGVCRCQRP